MTRLFLTLALTFATAIAVAQPNQAQQEELQQRLADVAERLELTEEQKVQIEPIITESFAQQQQLLRKYGIDPSGQGGRPSPRTARQLRGDMQDLRENTRQQLDGILSETQMEEFARLQDEMRTQMRNKIRGGR
ncbi:MAG: hypothetical protein AAF184_08005 [Pseudomonadota bacterium]